MARLSHKDLQELKHDHFAEGVGGWLRYVSEHPGEMKKWGALVVVALIALAGFLFYRGQQADERAKALFEANFIADARIEGDGQPAGPNMVFPTQEERDAAVAEAFQGVVDKYEGTQEGAIAELYLAGAAADRGDIETAIVHYRSLVDSAPEEYASVAKLSLAESLGGQGKIAEAEELLNDLIEDPSVFVSSEEAQLTLARLLGPSDPDRARTMLESLQQGRAVISRYAIQELAKLPAVTAPVADAPGSDQ